MLTLRQTLVASGQDPHSVMRASGIPLSSPGHTYSLAQVSTAYESQRRIYFVSLISPSLALLDDVQTVDALLQKSNDPGGSFTASELVALSQNLERFGILLRLVSTDLRRAALIGSVSAFAEIPTWIVTDENLVQTRDFITGVKDVATGAGAAAGVIVAVAVTANPPTLALIAAIAAAGAAGVYIGIGIAEIVNSMEAPTTPSPDGRRHEVEPPESDLTQPVQDSDDNYLDVPNAVAIGDPPVGLDAGELVASISDLALDLLLSDIPLGWDPEAGVGLPGIGAGDLTHDDDSGGSDFPGNVIG